MEELTRDMPECESHNMSPEEREEWESETVLGRMSKITKAKNELKRLMGLDERHECYESDARQGMI